MAEPVHVVVGLDDQVRAQHLERMQEAWPEASIVQEPDRKRQLALAPETEVFVGWPDDDFIEAAQRLRWIQLASAGADSYVDNPILRERRVRLTNASGVFGPTIAEHVMGMLLALTRQLHTSIRLQAQAEWTLPEGITELVGKRLLILGFGDIGREVAVRAQAFGMRIAAIKRQPGPKPPEVDELAGSEALDRLLGKADVVVVSLPLTGHTRGLLDARRLGLLPDGAILINVGRGPIVDQPALEQALQSGRLAGAGLDVFETEPLPKASKLWRLPNVIVTPHASGRTPLYRERFCEIVCQNLRRYAAGEHLRNRVDRRRGY